MGGTSMPGTPGPVDYTPAMINASDNQLMAHLAQTSTQQLLGTLMAANQSQQIMSNTQVALGNIDAKLEIAQMNFSLAEEALDVKADEARMEHEEKMEEIRVQEHAIELEAQRPVVATEDISGFDVG